MGRTSEWRSWMSLPPTTLRRSSRTSSPRQISASSWTSAFPAKRRPVFEGEVLEQDTVFRVGRVVSVEGRQVRVAVDKLKNSSHLLFRGGIVRNVSVGGYLKIVKGFSELIAKVDGEVIEVDRAASTIYRRGVDPMSRQLQVSLIGYVEGGRFERGVREMPLLDNECFILTESEFGLIHTFVEDSDTPVEIGVLAMEPTQ